MIWWCRTAEEGKETLQTLQLTLWDSSTDTLEISTFSNIYTLKKKLQKKKIRLKSLNQNISTSPH